jgi:flagellar protein FliO/FliZ
MDEFYWRFVGAFVLVVGLIFAVAWIAKRLGLGGRIVSSRGKRRLSVQEVLPLDGKRRLVLVKRDGIEHLLLIGMNDDLVVERGIAAPQDKVATDFAAMVPGAPS